MMHLRNGPFICFKPSIIHSILISQMTGMQVVNGGMGNEMNRALGHLCAHIG